MDALAGKRVTVMGLGRHGGGLAASRWLAAAGADVTVTDLQSAAALKQSLDALCTTPIARFRLEEHHLDDFIHAEMIVVNPAVRPGHPLVAAAAAAGAVITSEIELFLERCPAAVIGVTGSNGKTTTATLLAEMLCASGARVWLGGNIGGSLLADLPRMRDDDAVVLELSSFQLAHLRPQARPPRVAVVTNCTPNHLDWHGDFAAYVAAKQRIATGLPKSGILALSPAAPELAGWTELGDGKVILRPGMPIERLPLHSRRP